MDLVAEARGFEAGTETKTQREGVRCAAVSKVVAHTRWMPMGAHRPVAMKMPSQGWMCGCLVTFKVLTLGVVPRRMALNRNAATTHAWVTCDNADIYN